jgi:hypothetical protein
VLIEGCGCCNLERPAIEELSAIAVAGGVILWSQFNVIERRGNEQALSIGRICPSPALPVLGDDNRPKSDGGRQLLHCCCTVIA